MKIKISNGGEKMSFIVAIDGPAGSGKGTVAKLIGERLNLTNIDTGAMFRCIALQMQRENVKLEDEEKIKEILDKSNIELKTNKGILKVYLNGEDVSTAIRTEEVSNFVSPVSTIKIVREKLLMLQRKIAETQDVVMEGRDIGTAVFPNANVKIFLVASIEERAKRRMKQLQEKEAQQREELMRAHSELYTLQQQHRALLTAHQMSGGNEADRLKAKEQLTRIIAQVTRAMEALKQ